MMALTTCVPAALACDQEGAREVLTVSVSYDNFETIARTISFTPSTYGPGFMKETMALEESQAYAYFRIDEMTVAKHNAQTNEYSEEQVTDLGKVEIAFQTEAGTYTVEHSGATVRIPMALLNQPRGEYDSMSFQYGGSVAILHFSGSGQGTAMEYAPFAGTYVCADSGQWFSIDDQGLFVMPGTTQTQNPIELVNIVLKEDGNIASSQVMAYTYNANLYFDWNSGQKTLKFAKSGGGQPVPEGLTAGDRFERAKLQLNSSSLSLQVGQSAQMELTAQPAGAAVSYRSEDEAVATVDANGRVTAQKPGQTAITAKLGDLAVRCAVTVEEKTQEQDAIDALVRGEDATIAAAQTGTADRDVLQAAKDSGAKVTYEVKDEAGRVQYSWTFDGRSLTDVSDVKLDIALQRTSGVDTLDKALAPDDGALVLAFAHSGALPGPAKVTVDVSGQGFADGQQVTLYHYDPATGQLEKLQTLQVQNGKVEMTITHCSLYVLSARDDLHTGVADTASPKTGDDAQGGWIVLLVLCASALGALGLGKRRLTDK